MVVRTSACVNGDMFFAENKTKDVTEENHTRNDSVILSYKATSILYEKEPALLR